mgnify:CR=1 FL=1
MNTTLNLHEISTKITHPHLHGVSAIQTTMPAQTGHSSSPAGTIMTVHNECRSLVIAGHVYATSQS